MKYRLSMEAQKSYEKEEKLVADFDAEIEVIATDGESSEISEHGLLVQLVNPRLSQCDREAIMRLAIVQQTLVAQQQQHTQVGDKPHLQAQQNSASAGSSFVNLRNIPWYSGQFQRRRFPGRNTASIGNYIRLAPNSDSQQQQHTNQQSHYRARVTSNNRNKSIPA
ncbi:hypothetical protein GQX74_015675 [Glossina fuscipes]|nr:hypothetical protein GQX74_015675 [Glossina fuscipes]